MSTSELFCGAAETAIEVLAKHVNGRGGIIMINHAGQIGFAHHTPNLAHAYLAQGISNPAVGI
ncbi:MAG: hypothetical protein AAF485_18405 [Chloroflexota bacterium]